jgi:hypothetical protein
MTTAGEIAIVLGMLTLLGGGSLIAWIFLFRYAAKTEREASTSSGPASHVGDHA